MADFDKVDFEKAIALYALNYAKEIIDFQQRYLPALCPKPPVECIDKARRMITDGKLPWE